MTRNTRFAIVGFKAEFKDGFVLEKLVNNRKIYIFVFTIERAWERYIQVSN
jgi:hypothetical protein